MTGFRHDIAGGNGNLVVTSLQSPNFTHDVSGWQIAKDGSAEFNDLTIRGQFLGTEFIINSLGAFFYSGTPAKGNLIASIASVAGADDGLGNNFGAGVLSYTPDGTGGWTAFSALAGGDLQVGGSTLTGTVQTTTGGDLEITNAVSGESLLVLGQAAGGAMLEEGYFYAADPSGGTPEAWHTLTLTNATASGNGVNGMRYRLMPDNTLMLEWDIDTNSKNNVTIATLPAGWRPAVAHNIGSGSYGGSTTLTSAQNPHLTVNTNGTITMAGTSAAAFSMCGTARIGMD